MIISLSKDTGAALRVAHWVDMVMPQLIVGHLGSDPTADRILALNVVLEVVEGNDILHAVHEVLTASLHAAANGAPARVAEPRVRSCRGQHALGLVLVLLLERAKVVE